jgi:hypothetical protein
VDRGPEGAQGEVVHRGPGRGSMALCALVGLLLLVSGASALPRPSAVVHAADAGRTRVAPSAGEPPASGAGTGVARPAPTASEPPGVSQLSSVAGAVVPEAGPRTYRTAKVSAPTTARSGRLYRVDVRVEKGVGVDPDTVARTIARTLDDPRSWRSTGRYRFTVVPAGQRADLHAYVVTPGTTDRLCYPLLTRGEVSCQAGDKVVLNAKRWVLGADAYGPGEAEVTAYREYLVNHEFGHALGRQHVGCPRKGRPAPVMLQQTKGLQGCTANPWPSVTKG